MHELKQIRDFPGYDVCKCGLVWKYGREDPMTPNRNQRGYEQVGMTRDGKQYRVMTSHLVAEAFIPKPYPRFDSVIHLDGNEGHNWVDNLAWRPDGFARLHRAQFKVEYPGRLRMPFELIQTGEVFQDSLQPTIKYGLLERAVILSVLDPNNETTVFPHGYTFQLID